MNNYNNILLAALGGAVIGGLIAAFVSTKKEDEEFPLSPSMGTNDFSDTSSDYTNSELGNRSERKEAFQPS
ncbi:hypothetical protein HMI54_012503 [Coelomomyces lativittatus]|nr:hypothetical protein HMI54_012503 [Coelomomyces lativittatus]